MQTLQLLDRQVTTDYVEGLERVAQMGDAVQKAIDEGVDVGSIITQHLSRHVQHKATSLQAIIETTVLALQELNLDAPNQKIVNTIVDALKTSIGASKLRINNG